MDSFVTVRLPALEIPNNKEAVATPRPNPSPAADAELSDESILLRISEGDRAALGLLFRRYARIIRGICYRVLWDTSEADDLLQDIFLLLDRKSSMFDPARGPARFWILRISYHCALARRRYLNSRHFYTRVDLEDAENQLADSGVRDFVKQGADDTLLGNSGLKPIFESLSRDQRETLRLFFVEGYTLPEIAAKLNQTHGNIKHHYFRGLEKLRKHLFEGKLRASSAV